MRAIGYCRVSTVEQAAEGYSVEAQAQRIRDFAKLRDLGPVEIVSDPGVSAKGLDRPGLNRVRTLVAEGELSAIIVWHQDRLSRDVGESLTLAEEFQAAGVLLLSLTGDIDLNSANGRMFYTITGAVAQQQREHIIENVLMGMERGREQGRHLNRAKFGYRMVDGFLKPDELAASVVRDIFEMRAAGRSFREIEETVGVKYSTVASIVHSRVYLGEIPHRGGWLPGIHEPLISEAQWGAAQRAHIPGRRRSSHFLSGRVRCGMCERAATVQENEGKHSVLFRCRHRGSGCKQPARAAAGLERAAVLGLQLLRNDRGLRKAIRSELSRGPREGARERRRMASEERVLEARRRKLLDLHYAGALGVEAFGQEEARIGSRLKSIVARRAEMETAQAAREDSQAGLEAVTAALDALDFEEVWKEATDDEKRVLIEELLESVSFFPDHLEVTPRGGPTINVLLDEVGLKAGVGERVCRRGELNPHALAGTSPSS